MTDAVALAWYVELVVDDEVFLYVPSTGCLVALDRSAGLVWREHQLSGEREQLAARLLHRHGGDEELVGRVVAATLAQLDHAGLLRSSAHEAPSAPRRS